MATEKSIAVLERMTKTQRGNPITFLKEVKTDGTVEGSQKAIALLKEKRTPHFEVVDQKQGTKTIYHSTLSSKNYERKVVKI